MRTNKVSVAQKHSQSLRHAFTRSARVMRRASVRQSRAKSIGKQNTLMVSHVTVGRRQPNLSYFNLDGDPCCCFLVTLLDGYHQYVLNFRLIRPGCRHWLRSLYSNIPTHLGEGGGEHCVLILDSTVLDRELAFVHCHLTTVQPSWKLRYSYASLKR